MVKSNKSGQEVSETYKVVVDNSKTLTMMLKSCGFDWWSEDINSAHFPVHGCGSCEENLVLVHLNREVTSAEVREYLNEKGLMPATMTDLLALGATYPELQRQFPIVALGSLWLMNSDNRYSPMLNSNNHGERFVVLKYVSDRHICFDDTCRFLAMHK